MRSERPYSTYKGFGGILAAVSLPFAILVLIRDTPPGGGPPAPLYLAILPGILGAIGIFVFVASDRMIKRMRGAQAAQGRPRRRAGLDVRGMLIAAGLCLLYLILVVLGPL